MIKKIILLYNIILIYWDYFFQALAEIYLYYTSPYPLLLFMKKFSLANRKIKITLFPSKKGRPPIDQEIIDLILELKKIGRKVSFKSQVQNRN